MSVGLDNTADNVSVAGINEALGKEGKDAGTAFLVLRGLVGSRHKEKKKKEDDARWHMDFLNSVDGHDSDSIYTTNYPGLPVGECISPYWAQSLMFNLNNAGWVKLIRAMRKDDLEILEELNEQDWLDLADHYGITLYQDDLDFLCDSFDPEHYHARLALEAA